MIRVFYADGSVDDFKDLREAEYGVQERALAGACAVEVKDSHGGNYSLAWSVKIEREN
jgi:hypothetical protein